MDEDGDLLSREEQDVNTIPPKNTPPQSFLSESYKPEERFSLAMRGANAGVWDWNFETDEIYYSPRWKKMLGFGPDELEGNLQTWETLVHPDDKERVLAELQDYLSGNANVFEIEMRMSHKKGHYIFVLSRAFLVTRQSDSTPLRLVGTHVDISLRKKSEEFNDNNAQILEMIAIGRAAKDVYEAIALMYESRHPGLRCSMLELHGNKLLHGGAPSLPKEYCDAVHGLENGPSVGSCGTSTFTGKRVVVEDIATDPKWEKIKDIALPHGMRCCWSEPIKSSTGKVLGAFGMYYNHTAVPNKEESKDLASAASLASIIMERDHAQKRIRKLAYTDELTNLPSRAHLYQTIETTIETSALQQKRFGLLYVDLDDFKNINDSLGHNAGDLLLCEIARRLKNACPEADFVARLGGDEFCVIAEQVDDCSAEVIAKRCLAAIAKPFELMSRKITPACSIGIAHYPTDGNDLASLLKAADISLYAAKENGRNQIAFYKPELSAKAEYRFKVEQYLRGAIDNSELSLVYQPQINLETGEIIGVEALSRWHHPDIGHVPPVDFIDTAERIGMIKPLTEWVLKTSCKQMMDWKSQGLGGLRMAVNISPSHFLDEAIVPLISRIIKETGITPEELELEVTESVVQTDPRNLNTFKKLKSLGVQLAIDDFGTGYSSFASLKHLNVDCLKIDRCFVSDMTSDEKTQILIHSMIEMGLKLGYEITAEGVETTEQCADLQKLNCSVAQGYLFSHPVTATEISALLQQQNHQILSGEQL